jgi:signal peptidase I
MMHYAFLLQAVMMLFVTSCANYYLPTGSMEPTILLGDQLFASTINCKPVKRGDIVIFKTPDDEKDYIKRCIAVEGDSFVIQQGAFYLNGSRLDEPYVRSETLIHQGMHTTAGTVPKGMIFVLGDNRENSFDSRQFGFVPVDKVTGKAVLVYGNKLKADRGIVWVK